MRFTAFLDVSSWDTVNNNARMTQKWGPTSSLTDSASLSNLGRSTSSWEPDDAAVFFWRTIGDTRRGDTIRPLIFGGVLSCALRLGDDSMVELRNEFFFLIDNGSMAPGVFWTPWGIILAAASVFPVGSNGCLRLRGRGDTDLGGVTGGRFRLCKVVSRAESRVSKSGSGPGLAPGLGGRGEGLRGPRGRLPETFRDDVLSGSSLTSVSEGGKRRFVGVVERWLRTLPEARDDGRNGSGGLSVGIFSKCKNAKYITTFTFIYCVFDRSVPWRFHRLFRMLILTIVSREF